MLFGSVSGGLSAELTGGNFWQGAATGLVVSGLNHVAHRMENEETFFAEENGDPIKKPTPDASKLDERYKVGKKEWEFKGGRWTITTKKEILQWDSKKGEIEVYNRGQKKHMGGYDPFNKGRQISPPKSSRVPNGGWKVTTSKVTSLLDDILKPVGKIFRVFDLMAIPAMTMEQLQWGDPTNYQQQL